MISSELQIVLDRINQTFTRLQDSYWKVFGANGYRGNDLTIELSDLSGQLAELSRETQILTESLRIAEQNISDPTTPADRLDRIKRKYAQDQKKADTTAKKAERIIAKSNEAIAKADAWKPESSVPEIKPEEKPKPEIKPAPTPKTIKPVSKPTIVKPQQKSIITDVFNGITNTKKLPVDYYENVSGKLMKSVSKGAGSIKGFEPLVDELMVNAQSFAAAKTYNMVRDIEAALKNVSGFDDFEQKAKAILKQYDTWGEAEINTAQQQTHQAKQWQIITEDADMFPLLRYSTIGDACRICRPLDGMVAPVGDPIWLRIYPCNHYNCYCIVLQETRGVNMTDKHTRDKLEADSVELMNPVFMSNPGITKKLFTGKHPYFASVPKDDKAFAKENFGLPLK